SVPSELHHPCSGGLGNRLCAVCAARINHHDLLRERDAGETVAQVRRFVLNRDKHGQRRPRVGPLAHGVISRFLLSRAGFPTTMLLGFTSFIATARAPTIAPSPTVTPGPTTASAQIHASDPITIGGRSSGKSGLV